MEERKFPNPQSEIEKDEILKDKEEQVEELRDKIMALIDLYYSVFISNKKISTIMYIFFIKSIVVLAENIQ